MGSLHAEALAAAGVTSEAMSDRDLAILLLRAITRGDGDIIAPRWAHLGGVLHHGSGVRQSLLRAAGINPDELKGWPQEGACPWCGNGEDGEMTEADHEGFDRAFGSYGG